MMTDRKYGLARKFNPATARKEYCLAVFAGDYPDFAIHWFGGKPEAQQLNATIRRGPSLELTARNDYAMEPYPYGVS